jgi:C4-dicarboxylate transporter
MASRGIVRRATASSSARAYDGRDTSAATAASRPAASTFGNIATIAAAASGFARGLAGAGVIEDGPQIGGLELPDIEEVSGTGHQ